MRELDLEMKERIREIHELVKGGGLTETTKEIEKSFFGNAGKTKDMSNTLGVNRNGNSSNKRTLSGHVEQGKRNITENPYLSTSNQSNSEETLYVDAVA